MSSPSTRVRPSRLVRALAVLAWGLAACGLAAQQPTVEEQADAIRDLVLSGLEEEQPYWTSEHRETAAEAFRTATMVHFPAGLPAVKQAAIESWIPDFCHSNYRHPAPEIVPFHEAVIDYIVGDIAVTPEMTEEERARLDEQIEELAIELRAGILTKLPTALSPHVGLGADFIAMEFGTSADGWVEEYRSRANRDMERQNIRGLKRPLTAEEYGQALEWLEAAVTNPDMPQGTGPRQSATPAHKMELADLMGRMTALSLAVYMHELTKPPIPEEFARLRKASARAQLASDRYGPYLDAVSAALLLCIGGTAQDSHGALPLPWP